MKDIGNNWVRITDYRVPFREKYAYIDSVEGYEADQVFAQNKISVFFGKSMARPEDKYGFIYCSIWKKDRERFKKALEELANKHILKGNTDYPAFCEEIIGLLCGGAE